MSFIIYSTKGLSHKITEELWSSSSLFSQNESTL